MITNTTHATNSSVLLPVQDGPVNDCRKLGVKFVRVQLRLDFSSLAIASVTTHSCILLEEYYIELPQTTKAMNTGTNQAYNLTTWQGHANLKVLSCETVKTDILDITFQDGRVDLQPAAFGLTSARTKGTVLESSIDSKIMKLAYATVCKTMFTELCPNYSYQLHTALDLIKQVFIDPNGNLVSAPISAYYMRLMSAARTFTSEQIYPISLCAKFIEGMDPRLLPGFQRNFPNIAPLSCYVLILRGRHFRKCCRQLREPKMIT
jgi:hypothetical protein